MCCVYPVIGLARASGLRVPLATVNKSFDGLAVYALFAVISSALLSRPQTKATFVAVAYPLLLATSLGFVAGDMCT